MKSSWLNPAHLVSQLSFFALILFLLLWTLWLSPTQIIHPWLWCFLLVLPLLFAIKGVLSRRLYTYAWLQFINMIYLCHAIVLLMGEQPFAELGWLELSLVLFNFSSAVVAIRLAKQ